MFLYYYIIIINNGRFSYINDLQNVRIRMRIKLE